MPGALDVLPLDKAKEHLNREKIRQPGDEEELVDFIGAAVERVTRHLGRFPEVGSVSEQLACKVVLAEYWKTQRPSTVRTSYPTAAGEVDDGPTSGVSIGAKLAELLGPAKADAGGTAQGLFPNPLAWPDPIEPLRRY